MRSRIAHSRIVHQADFPDYSAEELLSIAKLMLVAQNYRFSREAEGAFAEYICPHMTLPHFADARSIRKALDRARLRQAHRLFSPRGRQLSRLDFITLEAGTSGQAACWRRVNPAHIPSRSGIPRLALFNGVLVGAVRTPHC